MCCNLSSCCTPCKESFTSYSQHLPIPVLPKGRISPQALDALVVQGQIPISFSFDDTGSVWQPVSSRFEELPSILSCRPNDFSPPPRAPIIPVRCSTPDLPPEIWIRIFTEAPTDLHQWLTPLRISLVCHYWRDIAHSVPHLWTNICVDVRHVKRSGRWIQWRTFQIVWWFLHLSKHKPLDVKVDLLEYDGDLEFERTVEIIAEHSARWRRADIRAPPSSLSYLKCVASRLPLLEDLSVDVAEEAYRSSKRFKGFRRAPKLVSHSPGGISARQCFVPWAQLRTVVLRDFFDCDLHRNLRDSKILDHLVLSPECEFETGFGTVTTLTASTMTIQSLPRLVSSFLRGFRFPFLTSLNFSISDTQKNSRPFPTDSLVLLLQQSECELQHLGLKKVPIPCEDMISVLKVTPALVSLTVHELASSQSYTHCITNGFLRYLMLDPVLPKLRSLELVWNHDASEECIIDMVESRLMKSSVHGGIQLERIVLGRRNGLDLELSTIEQMHCLRRRGLQIYLW